MTPEQVIRRPIVLTEKANLLLLDINTTDSEIKTLETAMEDYQNGKTPAQPRADGQANTSVAAKQTAQTTAGNTHQ